MSDNDIFHQLAKGYSEEDIDKYVQSLNSAGVEYFPSVKSLINKRNQPQKYTPLHSAIFARNINAVKAFIKLGVIFVFNRILYNC